MRQRFETRDDNWNGTVQVDSLLSDIVTSAKYFVFALLFVTLIGQFVIVHRRLSEQAKSHHLTPIPVAYSPDALDGEFEWPFSTKPDFSRYAEDSTQFYVEERATVYRVGYSDE